MTANYMLKKQETGRSMVEMLGVLAIIGVLSVGGIAGYTSAMRSYRANEIINGASMLYMMGLAQNMGEGTGTMDFSSIGPLPKGCKGMTYTNGRITVNIEDATDCATVKTKLGDKASDCTAATGGATGYTLTVTLGKAVEETEGGTCSEEGNPYSCPTQTACLNAGYSWGEIPGWPDGCGMSDAEFIYGNCDGNGSCTNHVCKCD